MGEDIQQGSANPEEFETISCALCGGENHAKVFDAVDIKHGVPGVFTMVRCRGCGLAFLNPRYRKEFLGRLYPADYEPHVRYCDGSAGLKERAGMQAARYQILKKAQKYPGVLLDVGSGAGDFLDYTEKRGWNAHGVEPDEEACLEQKKLGLKVYDGELTNVEFDSSFFDVVTFWAVLEHVPDPVETLQKANRVLRDGGAVVIQVPDFNSIERLVFGSKWYGLDTPRHLYHYTPGTLRQMLEKTGFEVESVTHSTTATCLVNSLRTVFRREKKEPVAEAQSFAEDEGGSKGGGLKGAVKRALFFWAFVPFLRAMDGLGRGGYMIVIARKQAPAQMDLHAPEADKK